MDQLEAVFDMQLKLSKLLKEINSVLSPGLLLEVSTCLCTAVFYLYRICVSSLATTLSSDMEVIHYFVSGGHRFLKLLVLILLGELIKDNVSGSH